MQLTIDLPNLWGSEKKTAELINRIEQITILLKPM